MKVKSLTLNNVKSFRSTGLINFSEGINILVGPNNSGKSTILKSLSLLQLGPDPHEFFTNNISKKEKKSSVTINLSHVKLGETIPRNGLNPIRNGEATIVFTYDIESGNTGENPDRTIKTNQQSARYNTIIRNREPDNFIIPFFSKRKTTQFSQVVNSVFASEVKNTLENLYSKIDRITSNSDHPAYSQFQLICKKLFGYKIVANQSKDGKEAGIYIDDYNHIPLQEMGEGTTNILGLLVNLYTSKNKLFLIEELENDLHPEALKDVLEIIILKSSNNQFIISTHSNIVVKTLCSNPDTSLFNIILNPKNKIPISSIEEIGNSPNERIKILRTLGYDLFDFDLYNAYLILEESTAERIIRDFIIPQFAPILLGKLRTIAASGTSDLEPRFHDFLRLFVFVHTANDIYQNKAWVIADGDTSGKEAIRKIQENFKAWDKSHFLNFSESQFENYYPKRFEDEVTTVLSIENSYDRMKEKGKLAEKVLQWSLSDIKTAKKEFSESAAEVIQIIKQIEESLSK